MGKIWTLMKIISNIYIFRDEISVEEIPEQYKQETEDRRRDLIGISS